MEPNRNRGAPWRVHTSTASPPPLACSAPSAGTDVVFGPELECSQKDGKAFIIMRSLSYTFLPQSLVNIGAGVGGGENPVSFIFRKCLILRSRHRVHKLDQWLKILGSHILTQ